MVLYKNAMETVVENVFDEISGALGCCTCESCRNDIIAYALNQLPPKYVVSTAGIAYTKLFALKSQREVDIISALTMAANIVQKNPKHRE